MPPAVITTPPISSILLTGGLGRKVCAELLAHTPHIVYCLVRGQDSVDAEHRFGNLTGLSGPAALGRLVVVPGDVTQPDVGLAPRRYNALVDTIDTIIHCAASVNLALDYPQLEAPNVIGTRNLINLARRRAERTKNPPRFHYISTGGVLGFARATGLAEVDEDTIATDGTAGDLGYTRSKAVAEAELRAAGADWLPLTIFRPALITGHSQTGRSPGTDMLRPLVRAALAIGAAPTAGSVPAEMIDVAAKAIVTLGRRPDTVGRTFHLFRDSPLEFTEVFDALRRSGHELEHVAPQDWWQRIERSNDHPDVAPLQLMNQIYRHLVPVDPADSLPRFRSRRTLSALTEAGIRLPRLDSAYLDRLAADITATVPSPAPSPQEIRTTTEETTKLSAGTDHSGVRIDGYFDPQSFDDCASGAADAAAACEAESLGTLWVAEHKHDPLLVLSAAAGATESVGVGTNVLIALAHRPLTVAMTANDLHATSGGRLTLGLGTQIETHLVNRYSAPGDRRRARMREFVLALRAIWTSWNTQEPLNFRGEFYHHTLMTPFFTPPPNPYGAPKIILAAVGPRMAELAGEIADGLSLHTILSPDYIAETIIPAALRGLEKSGRSRDMFTIVCRPYIVTGRTPAERAEIDSGVRSELAFLASTRAYRIAFPGDYAKIADRLTELSLSDLPDKWSRMTDLIDDDILGHIAICTDTSDVGKEIRKRLGHLVDNVVIPAPCGHHKDLWHPATLHLYDADPSLKIPHPAREGPAAVAV
ncbi:TIGR03617 family F420-dependent LLM class oxidoreductase [Nocardia goodfellowii]